MTRQLVVFGIIMVTSLIVGVLGALCIPKLQVSITDITIKTELPTSEGLGSFQQVDVRRDNELQGVVQWMGSEAAIEDAVARVGNYEVDKVRSGLELKTEPGTGAVSMMVTARSKKDAVHIAEAILEHTRQLEQERRTALVDKMMAAVKMEIDKCEKSYAELSLAVSKKIDAKGIVLTEDKSRQDAAVALLQHFRRELLNIEVQRSKLRSEIDEHDKKTTDDVATDIFDRDPEKRDYVLSTAQQQVLNLESELTALRSRYGDQHQQVIAAKTRLEQAIAQLKDLTTRQRAQVERQLEGNAAALQTVQDGFSRVKREMLSQDLLQDPEMAALVNARDVASKNYALLNQRMMELSVYKNLQDSVFDVVSGPYPDDKHNLKVMSGCVFGCMVLGGAVGLIYCIRMQSRGPRLES